MKGRGHVGASLVLKGLHRAVAMIAKEGEGDLDHLIDLFWIYLPMIGVGDPAHKGGDDKLGDRGHVT